MYRVLREIHFSYGHRLLDHPGKCKRLHGHNGRVVIELSSQKLNEQDMVMDFDEIREAVGSWIAETLDHRMILSEKDPLIKPLREAGEPLVVIPESPTAEILAKKIFEAARHRRLPVARVTLWETPASAAVYHE